ncbi:helix-turn-helix domain-containing protein [Herbiconiux sp. CPCC 205763]|uniref:Helix-turn-helix domain-containing protein n=1 Tax=Herbiconiux aconitum TaxID=2970913 RepID=A0ABT2GUX4_9MICO|nr:helix-turn-helix domain-containing protein [Herbiconiux aconitum]MCS5720014.1 helix-turn-helix domain-containing protein [Herbiconiux aconitum]
MSDLIRTARARSGMSIYDLAPRLGVTAGAVSQLERSERAGTIKLASLERALDALGERLHISTTPATMAEKHLMSARSAARAIDAELKAADPAAALRLTTQAIDHFRRADSENEIADFLKKPPAISDPRWDTLFATAVAWDAARRGITPPRWTMKPALEREWVPGPDSGYSARYVELIKSTAEPEFLERGIVIREKDLTAA